MADDTLPDETYDPIEDEFENEATAADALAEQVQSTVASLIDEARDFVDTDLAPEREKALQAYRGDPYGDEEEGRSQYVSRDVHDTVKAMLPSLLRTFFGSQHVVEFAPVGPEDVQGAEQATDYVSHIVSKDNPGFTILYSAVKDALTQATGVIKYWWDESVTVEEETYSGLDEDTMALLAADPEVEIAGDEAITVDEAEDGTQTYTVTVKRRRTHGRVRYCELPPEEFLIARGARSVEEAPLVAHQREATFSELVALGYAEEDLEQHLGEDSLTQNSERVNREDSNADWNEDYGDPSQRKVLYTEAYARVDTDGDGIAEMRKFCCVGSAHEILHSEAATEAQFVVLCPDPEPHQAIGSSTADSIMDVQRLKTSTIRRMNDSLAQSIHPRTGVVEGQANMDDVLNNETGAVIRMRREGAVQPFITPFVGKEAFPMLAYFDKVKEARTGITETTQGLSPENLQSTDRLAVRSSVEAAQQQLELVARVMSETALKRLYRGIFNLVKRHQDKPRMIRLRGDFVQMDPRSWNADMDVEVNTSLGTGTTDDKLQRLMAVEALQEKILQQLGPNNPLVTLGQYSHTLSRIVELAGFKDASQFFNEHPRDFSPAPPPPQPTPEELLAQAQMAEIHANIQKKAAELELEREKMLRTDDRVRDKQEAEVMLRATDLEAQHGIEVNIDEILAHMHHDRSADAGQYQ